MSRFSRAEAEAKGWRFAHSSEEEVTITSETQGETRVRPASVRAEKTLSGGGMINEEAETMGKLLERIHSYEEQLERKNIEQTAVPVNVEEEAPADPDTDLPIRHVILPSGEKITDAELSARGRVDAIVTESGEQIFTGPERTVAEIDAAKQAVSRDAEDERTAAEEIPHEQIAIDDSQTVVDLPGGATGSVLVVREGEDVNEVQDRRIAEKTEAEESKSLVAPVPEAESEQDESGEDPEDDDEEEEVDATPAAEEAAEEHDIDLSEVEVTGKGGRVTKADVEAAAEE
jgi:pyruvate/2-oxoglutarate dehydrogenase complex dihydrolipoamide acyltransferase (E2) component